MSSYVVSIATLAIVALSFRIYYHVVRTIEKTVPLAKRVPIRERELRAWYCYVGIRICMIYSFFVKPAALMAFVLKRSYPFASLIPAPHHNF
jgi:hypothetical protein